MVKVAGGDYSCVYHYSRRLERLTALRDQCIEAVEQLDRKIEALRSAPVVEGHSLPTERLRILEQKRDKVQTRLYRIVESMEEVQDRLTDLRVQLTQEYRREAKENCTPTWVRFAWIVVVMFVAVILLKWMR